MTNDEMATLDALAAAATPGPWRVKPLKESGAHRLPRLLTPRPKRPSV